MYRTFFISLCIILTFQTIIAQDFGEVSQKYLDMTTYEPDPDAHAVIIFDKAIARITDRFELKTKFHKRIKILSEEGKKYANIKLSIWHEKQIMGIDAMSYSPDGTEYELDSDNIFEEKSGKRNVVSFAIPGVEIGSIIEYEYEIFSEYIRNLEQWSFQSEIPTIKSEISIFLKAGLTYNKIDRNFKGHDITFTSQEVIDRDDDRLKMLECKWIGNNLPAVQDEPFVYCYDDKIAHVIFELVSYKSLYKFVQLADSWQSVSERLWKNQYDDYVNDNGETEDLSISLTKNDTSNISKVITLYNYVKDEIETTKFKHIYSTEFYHPEKIAELKKGSSSEKNMLLINMLNAIDIHARPLLISTRSHGEVVSDHCDLDQFNMLLCLVIVDNSAYYLHTGPKGNPFGYLTPTTSPSIGLYVNEDEGTIISIIPGKMKNKKSQKLPSLMIIQ